MHQLVPEHLESLHKLQFLSWLGKLKNSSKVPPVWIHANLFQQLLFSQTDCERILAEVAQRAADRRKDLFGDIRGSFFFPTSFHRRLPSPTEAQAASPEPVTLTHGDFAVRSLCCLQIGASALQGTRVLQGRNSKVLRNPFDIDRAHVLDHLTRMRAFFLNPTLNESLGNEDLKHNTSIAAMGDYLTALRSRVVCSIWHVVIIFAFRRR